MIRLRELDVGVVDLIGAGFLPFRSLFSPVQPISFTITASPASTGCLLDLIKRGGLTNEVRSRIAETIREYVNILHGDRIGHLDFNPRNVLYDPSSDRVLLCDLERFSRMHWWDRAYRIRRDERKVRQTISLIMDESGSPGSPL